MNRKAFTERYRKAQTKPVTLPDGTVQLVRAITPGERDAFENWLTKQKDKVTDNFRAKWLSLVLCDEEGVRLYADSDVDEIKNIPGGADFEILFDDSWAFNGMSREALAELKKSSASAHLNGSASTSASVSASSTPTTSTAPPKAGASA